MDVSQDDCWLWARSTDKDDYGQVAVNSYPRRAHREMYIAFVGEIPQGLEINHLCRVTRCVNPDHLEAVTRTENMRYGYKPNACNKGHELTPENTSVGIKEAKTGRIGRQCKKCRKMRALERKQQRSNL